MGSHHLLHWLRDAGFDFFTGVPCSFLTPFLDRWNHETREVHLPAPREDLAVGLAAGAWLGGRFPVLYMQNSGLGYSLEAFASLHMIYRIPVLLVVSWRGPDDPGWEEHRIMGEHTTELLDTFGIPWRIWKNEGGRETARKLAGDVRGERGPVALLVKRGVLK